MLFDCFYNNIYFLSFGVFVPELKKYFDSGSGEVSTILSIQMGVTFASGSTLSSLLPRVKTENFLTLVHIVTSTTICQ